VSAVPQRDASDPSRLLQNIDRRSKKVRDADEKVLLGSLNKIWSNRDAHSILKKLQEKGYSMTIDPSKYGKDSPDSYTTKHTVLTSLLLQRPLATCGA